MSLSYPMQRLLPTLDIIIVASPGHYWQFRPAAIDSLVLGFVRYTVTTPRFTVECYQSFHELYPDKTWWVRSDWPLPIPQAAISLAHLRRAHLHQLDRDAATPAPAGRPSFTFGSSSRFVPPNWEVYESCGTPL